MDDDIVRLSDGVVRFTLREPYLGPIIAHTTDNYVNIWVCSKYPEKYEKDRVDIAVLCDDDQLLTYTILRKDTNMTGILHYNWLSPNTTYEVLVGIIVDVDINNISDLENCIDTRKFKKIQVTTFPRP